MKLVESGEHHYLVVENAIGDRIEVDAPRSLVRIVLYERTLELEPDTADELAKALIIAGGWARVRRGKVD